MAKDLKNLAVRYAKALQETLLDSRGEKVVEKTRDELAQLTVLNEGEVGTFFTNPVFGSDEKTKVLEAILQKNPVDAGLARFLSLLVSLGHLHLLPEIVKAYDEAERERKNEVRAKVRTARTLDNKESARLAAALGHATGKKVLVDVEVDPELIGGVVAEVGSVTYDASIRGYLSRLQQEF